jgi:hypothetical protein
VTPAERVADHDRGLAGVVQDADQVVDVAVDTDRCPGRVDRAAVAPAVVPHHPALVPEQPGHPCERTAPVEHTVDEHDALGARSRFGEVEIDHDP